MTRLALPLLIMLLSCSSQLFSQQEYESALTTLNKVGAVGQGHQEAVKAWATLSKASADSLPLLLRAVEDDKPRGANWIRTAIDQIAERSLKQGRELPEKELEAIIFEESVSPRARRLAYEWLAKVDETARERIIPQVLNDSSVEMRRDAVEMVLAKAESSTDKPNQIKLYRTALTAARDTDQIDAAFEKLTELGEKFELAKHFGFVSRWQLIGPFDNSNKGGFNVAYPPEKELKLDASYPGKTAEVQWVDHASDDKYGMIDLNKALGKNMGAAAYALNTFDSSQDRDVDFRLGCICASKVWLNGELLLSNEVYHSGTEIDQYRCRAKLKAGKNHILVKVCQNEQTESWAQDWQFQFRVCDKVGTAILSSEERQQ